MVNFTRSIGGRVPQFWWVNHNQTARQEIGGQYLWSPKTEKGGARSEFYNNMRRAVPGDIVLSFADQAIRYIGRVTDYAFTAPKPEEFGNAGANWSGIGWLLPVFWTPLNPPARPQDLLPQLAPLLPKKYSPISPNTGWGYQKCYLAAVPESVFDVIVTNRGYDAEHLKTGGGNRLNFEVLVDELDDGVEASIVNNPGLETTEKQRLVLARRGQGKFRDNVTAVEPACRLTGISNPALLIASHIKPWGLCDNAKERLDGMNGLLLTPDADKLFDRGFVSFDMSGAVLVSPQVPDDDLRRLGFEQLLSNRAADKSQHWRTGAFRPSQDAYLDFH